MKRALLANLGPEDWRRLTAAGASLHALHDERWRAHRRLLRDPEGRVHQRIVVRLARVAREIARNRKETPASCKLAPMTMPLVTCPNCERQISIAADTCPCCGRSTGLIGTPFVDRPPSESWLGFVLFALALVFELAAFFGACNAHHH